MLKIDFAAKSDRELLILVAQQGNETVDHLEKLNATIVKHGNRLTTLEATQGCGSVKSKWKSNWQTITLIATVVTLIIVEVVSRAG